MSDETPQQPPAPPPEPAYPVTFTFEGPEQLSRLSTFFRLILMIPLLIFLAILSGTSGVARSGTTGEILGVTGGVFTALVAAYLIAAFVRGGRPVGWLGSVLVSIQRFQLRAYCYVFLLTDKYPAFEGDWFAQYEAQRPERISRRQMVFWKFLTAIPHFIVIGVLWFAVAVCEVIAWFAILFTGRFPRGMRDFVVGWLRWSARVTAYVISLRDEFPPYSLSHYAGPGSKRAQLWSGLGGIALIVALVSGGTAAYLALSQTETTTVRYTSLTAGTATAHVTVNHLTVSLDGADDSYDFPGDLLTPAGGDRFIEFDMSLANGRGSDVDVDADDFKLKDTDGDTHEPEFVSLEGAVPPKTLKKGRTGSVTVVFEIVKGADPDEFKYSPPGGIKDAEFEFE